MTLLYLFLLACLSVTPLLLFVDAPYGKFFKPWLKRYPGFLINAKIAWTIQESPSLIFYIYGVNVALLDNTRNNFTNTQVCFAVLFLIHYFYRSFIYPLSLRPRNPYSLITVFPAVLWTGTNGFLNGFYLFEKNYRAPESSYIFLGISLFIEGFIINFISDKELLRLSHNRKDNEYLVPHGFFFEKVSCAHYFGEIIEWLGYYIATRNPASFVFFINVCANLVPRAIRTHKWYIENLENYPTDRKAIFPYIL